VDVIRRKHLKGGRLKKGDRREYIEREYTIYTRGEAEERDIQFFDWREVGQGQWGLTDDGWVGECTNIRQYKKKVNVVFSFGEFWYDTENKSGKCLYEPRRDSGSYTGTSPKAAWETYKGRKQYKNFVKVYVQQLLNGAVDYTVLGRVFGEDKNFDIKARLLLKKEYVKEMINEELKEVFEEKGIDEGTVIDMINNAHEVAKEKGDPGNMLRAAENFVKILKMDAKEEKKDTFDADISTLERIESTIALEPEPKKLENKKLLSE